MTKNVLSKDTVCLRKDRGGLGVPHVKIKCKSLLMRQLFRSITSNHHGRSHIFWLGPKLGLSQFTSNFFHVRGTTGKEKNSTPSLFIKSLEYVTKSFEDGMFAPADIEDITAKDIYTCLLSSLPPP